MKTQTSNLEQLANLLQLRFTDPVIVNNAQRLVDQLCTISTNILAAEKQLKMQLRETEPWLYCGALVSVYHVKHMLDLQQLKVVICDDSYELFQELLQITTLEAIHESFGERRMIVYFGLNSERQFIVRPLLSGLNVSEQFKAHLSN